MRSNVSPLTKFNRNKFGTLDDTTFKKRGETSQCCHHFFKYLLTSVFHYKIAKHAKHFLLQPLVTLINVVYAHYLTESRFVDKIPFKTCPNVSFLHLNMFC
jgi:hypothetical protein